MTLNDLLAQSAERPDQAEAKRQNYLLRKSEQRGVASRYLGKDAKGRPIKQRRIAYSYSEGEFQPIELTTEELRELAGLEDL
jgi:hypothetical protein